MRLDDNQERAFLVLIDVEKSFNKSVLIVLSGAGIWGCCIIGLMTAILADGIPLVSVPKKEIILSFWIVWAIGIIMIPMGAYWVWKKKKRLTEVRTSVEFLTDDLII